ncbi:hypothetical protein A3Q56_06808 [Intoshia linei]|uniref:Uncharacterized protein n=1 Tax=Intoshia linei TaxID=1819745 RepID=A0A177AUF5_9BILA|nr:hypothetical protein A3Q56_06808 [Intoshia linei]
MLTYNQKKMIIEYYQKNKTTFIRLAEIFTARFKTKINDRTIKNIIDSEKKVLNFISNGLGTYSKAPKLTNIRVEKDLIEQILNFEIKGGFLTDALIIKMAQEISKKLQIDNLKF